MSIAGARGVTVWMRSAVFTAVAATVLSACGLFLSEEEQLSRAQEAYKRGDFRAASIDLKSLLEKHPKNREARFSLGLADLESGDSVAAVRDLERARADGIDDPRIAEPLSRAYLLVGEVDKALQLLDAAVAKLNRPSAGGPADSDKSFATYQRLRGEVLLVKRDASAARKSFESALTAAPDDVRALLGLANATAALDGFDAAFAVTDRALAIAPKDSSVQLARGAMLLQLKRNADALDAFTKATELATGPTQKSALLTALAGVAQIQLTTGKIEDALATTARMEKLVPNSPLTRYMRAYALAQNAQLDQAQGLLEQNVAQIADVRSRMLLGAVNLMQGKLGQAEMHLASVVAATPDNTEARQLLAQTRLRQAKPGDALEVLLPALGGDNAGNAGLIALAGQASLAAGKTKEGVALLKRNVDAHPEDQRAQLDLVAGYLAAGQADQALAVLGGTGADKTPAGAANQSEEQVVRREYLAVIARLQKGDTAGAIAHAVKAAEQQPQNASLQALAGSALMLQRQYVQARPFADAVIRLRPDAAAGYANLGRLELMQGNVDAARRNFQTALQKRPGDTAATTSLALIELSAQKPDAALAVLGEARKHDPKSIETRVLETQVLLSQGKLDDAEKLGRETLELAPMDASVLAGLGRVLSTKGQHSQSLEMFERAVQAQPKSAPARFQLAMAQRAAGHMEDAAQTIRAVLKIDEHYMPAMQMDGLFALAKGDLTLATQHADALLRVAPDQAATHELVARLRAAQQRYADSAESFRKAGELQPHPQYAMGEYDARLRGKLAEPLAPLEKFLAAHPEEPSARIVLAEAQQRQGDRAAAIKSYERVLSNHPKNAIALNNLAWIRHEDGKPDAVDLARRAYEAAPEAPAVVDTYAWILTSSGKAKEALKLLDPIVGPSSKSGGKGVPADIRAHYAVALSRAGRSAEAKALAKELTAANTAELSNEIRTLMTELAKS